MQRRTILTALTVLTSAAAVATLPACGFKLRGSLSAGYAFKSIFSGFAQSSLLGQDFKSLAEGQGIKVFNDAAGAKLADLVLRVHTDQREKVVVGAGVAGQVREFQLRVRLKFSVFTQAGKLLLDEVEILQQREISYSESAALAKEAEEQLFYRDMQQEVVLQLMRRLGAIKTL